eukprot:CAMPEP_0170539870 /NCGR_PEP_ID=MMETSP0209-20121228/104269_1 /TAXON_ID=665100 ORGANISM="Litonotus pictus, Strain P1" /NCGR_SAMPLE_ID=MMETSP0209 /ASSEMBLY_ACC=CAM_ASM_000301 /LENGTH=664 /DNA_ID=CAMNT_0010842049 /DNA_START=3652 /DNA_END=5643 /DNA_ORIENTATION=+
MELSKHHSMRTNQILSVLFFIDSIDTYKEGLLLQISTGEGKSVTVAILAAFLILYNKISDSAKNSYVDIITSNSVLAQRDSKEFQGFYSLLSITVGENSDHDMYVSGEKKCYKKDIVYGSVDNFQFDILRDEYSLLKTRAGRTFGYVIIDEVDSMMIDDGAKIARLSNSIPSMEFLFPILTSIWKELDNIDKYIVKVEEQIFFITPPNKEQIEKYISKHLSSDSDKSRDILIEIEKGNIDMVDVITKENIQLIKDPQEFIKEHIRSYIYTRIQFSSSYENTIFSCNEQTPKIIIPNSLKQIVSLQLDKWTENALLAKTTYRKGFHYLVVAEEGVERITPVDYSSTGVVQLTTNWGDGLHQFIQLKEGLRLTPENITTNYLSNIGFFTRYKNNILGMTGTLGSKHSQDLFKQIYKVNLLIIPRFKERLFSERSGIIMHSKISWVDSITQNSLIEVMKGRAVLIINEYISNSELIYNDIVNLYDSSKVKLYNRNDLDLDTNLFSKVEEGEIIISTNLAGRGMDISTSQEVESAGGLHVIVSFLPENLRVEEQAFGRTARQGRKGTGIIILNKQDLMSIPEYSSLLDQEIINSKEYHVCTNNAMNLIKERRDKREQERIKQVIHSEVPDILIKDKLFKRFCEFKESLKGKVDSTYYLMGLEESWGVW